jgi:HAD superfamily hydrolase (TIGR01509 family)
MAAHRSLGFRVRDTVPMARSGCERPARELPELVIFDCDGVLVDSEAISNAVLARLLSAEGLPITRAQAHRAYQGLLLSEIAARAQVELGRALPNGWLERFERERAEAFRRELRPIPDAADAVQCIRAAGIPVCVASQAKVSKTELTLGLTGLREHFADGALFSAESVARGKPHPDLFLHAAATMGAEPTRSVVLEDSPSGVRAAVAARMRALGYAPESDDEPPLRGAGAATLLRSLRELPALLGLHSPR